MKITLCTLYFLRLYISSNKAKTLARLPSCFNRFFHRFKCQDIILIISLFYFWIFRIISIYCSGFLFLFLFLLLLWFGSNIADRVESQALTRTFKRTKIILLITLTNESKSRIQNHLIGKNLLNIHKNM